jgi:hypothetical protein
MEPIEYNDQLGEHLVRHLLFDPHADLFDGLQELSKLPTGVAMGANGTAEPQTTMTRRAVDKDDSSSSDDEPGVRKEAKRQHKGGKKFKRQELRNTDGALVDMWGRPIEPHALVLPDAPLAQYAPLYPPARLAAASPATMGTSLDRALLMLRVAFGPTERIDPQTFVVTAGIITSPMVYRIYAIQDAAMGPVVALSLNVQVIWRLDPEKVQLSMIYAALSLKAFSEWWAQNRDRRPSAKEIDRFLDTPSVVLKLRREDALPSRSDYVPLFELDPPQAAVNNHAVLDGWIANAKARFGLPQITALAIQFGQKKGAHKRMDIASSNAIVVRNGLFEQFAETDVVQLLLVAFVRWCRRHLNALDTTDRYVNAGGRLDLLFSKTFEKTFIA